jgi:hypothetical protein
MTGIAGMSGETSSRRCAWTAPKCQQSLILFGVNVRRF